MSMIDYEKTGKLIAELRKEKGMTQAHLAEKLGVTDRAVSKWERGKSFPDVGILQELARALDMTVGELLEGERFFECDEADAAIVKGIHLYIEERKKKEILRISLLLLVLIFLIGGCFVWKYFTSPIDFQKEKLVIEEIRILQEDGGWVTPHLYGAPYAAAKENILEILKDIDGLREIEGNGLEQPDGFRAIDLAGVCILYPEGYYDPRSDQLYAYTKSYAVYTKVEDIIRNLQADQNYFESALRQEQVEGNRDFIAKMALIEVGESIIADDLREMLASSGPEDFPEAYIKSITLHSVERMFADGIFDESYEDLVEYQQLKKEIDYRELYDFRIYKVTFETKYTEEMKMLGPQYPEGMRQRLYLIGKSLSDEEMKLYKFVEMGYVKDESE